MADNLTVAVGAVKTATTSITALEEFTGLAKLPGGATDTAVTLGTLTNPKYVAVFCDTAGVSFKITGGTDSLGAHPCAAISAEEDGLSISSVLLSNSGGSEVDVYIYAVE